MTVPDNHTPRDIYDLSNGAWQWNVMDVATGRLQDPNHSSTVEDAQKHLAWCQEHGPRQLFTIVKRWVSEWVVTLPESGES